MSTTTILNRLQKLSLTRASIKQNHLGIKRSPLASNSGFTLIELIVVVLIIAVLSTIAAPGWLGFVNRQRVNKANDAVLSILQEAQSEAKRRKLSYTVQFRQENNEPQVAVYIGNNAISWKNLVDNLDIQPEQIELDIPPADPIIFDYQGNVETNSDLPYKVTVSIPDTSVKRCVIVETLIGGIRTDSGENCNN